MARCRLSIVTLAGTIAISVGLFSIPTRLAAQGTGILREVYTGIAGGAIPNLTNHVSFPNSPTLESIEPIFEGPTAGDFYGTRMRALITAPATGNYIFWIATDDQGYLYLSTDETPTTRRLICAEPQWGGVREWEGNLERRTNATSIFPAMNPSLPANRSDYAFGTITLNAGQRYYIEALQAEGQGGDNIAVGWQLPDGTQERPIPGSRMVPYGLGPPIISQQPGNSSVIEGGTASFTVRLQRMLGATFQWRRNGAVVPGATNFTHFIPVVSLADSNTSYSCSITNSYGGTNSASGILTVIPDSVRPTINTVGNIGEPQVVFVVFSEPVEALSATNIANYSITGGVTTVTIARAAFGADSRTVILTTTTMLSPGVIYTLTVNNVRDRASTPNTILPNSQRTFSLIVRPLDISYLSLPREPIGPSSRRHGVVISEVMFHPTNRADGKNLEFLEVYNSQPWFEELGGWRISGAIDYTFPSNTVLQSRSFLVVAANPTDFKSVYLAVPATNVFGPFLGSNGLQNSSGTLRLRNNADAVVFEMNYTGDPPFPAAADGGGHSLVLGRPSYGERDARAWMASESAGGTPGATDPPTGNTFRNILINEILAHTDPPNVDYVELHNYGLSQINLSGLIVTDDPDTNKFVITSAIGNTSIPGRGFFVLNATQLGFALSASGETIFLKHPSGQRVIDALKYDSQENGVPLGRYPDAANAWTRLAAPTPGSNNAPYKATQVVINELMIDPASGDENDEFVELHNRGPGFVDVGGWRLRDGISFNIPQGTIIPAGGYLVIAKNAAQLRANYAALGTVNCLGNYSGALANNGERIELNFPDELVNTNAFGQLQTNTIHVAVDEVTYGPGGRWGNFAAGGGSSLELRDSRSDRRLAPNWADSDESGKSGWFTVEATGTMDNGYADANQLHVTLLGEGEALIDNVELIPAGSTNVVGNGTFETGIGGWVFMGNHARTSWETAAGFNSARSLHVRSSGRGDTGPNLARTQLPFTLTPGTVVTVRARARWLKGNPNVSLRVRGNWMEAVSYTLTAKNLGTPGLPNSRAVPNAGPAITEVLHHPALPAAGQQVLITAHVHDPDGLAFLAVNYRVDPSGTYTAVAMTNNGAGLYSTVIPGQASGGTVGFYVQAIDNFPTPATGTFPADAPNRECVVRWGDTTIPGTLGTYRMWLTQTNVSRWTADGKMSNDPKDTTFVYGTNRIAYNAGAWFHGSPWHSPAYDSPVGVSCDYDMNFMEDEPLLGETDINLFRPGNGGGEPTAQAEVQSYWFAGQFGAPFLYHRPVFVYVNGQRRDNLFHDAQQPNGDFVEQWYPNDADGDLHKIQIGYEFGDTAYGYGEAGFASVGADLNRYLTTGGAFKQARYRQTWARRSATFEEQNDYTNIYALVNVALTSAPIGSDAYTTTLSAATDVEEWYKIHVVQHIVNNPDSFSYGGGQNAFVYKPQRDTWKLFLWDIDFAFGGDPADGNLTGIGGAEHGPRNDHPPFARLYWQTLLEAANGMMTPARSDTILDARFNGMNAAGGNVGSPAGIKSFIATKRNVILTQAASRQAPFRIASNGGADFATNRNLITLSGTAPLQARFILINGAAFPVTWTSISNWTIRIPLLAGTNTLVFTAIDSKGAVVAGVSGTIRINYTGANELPQERIVLNEVMYNPVFANASYVEIYNTSPSNAFDMSGWRLNGADLTFANGTVLEPGQFMIAAKDRQVFADTYGPSIPVAADFPGSLDNGGETLTLLKPGATPAEDLIVDQFTYDDDLPWPAAADGGGPSLQLIDALQDNNRSANWAVVTAASTNPPQTLLRITNVWRYMQTQNLDGINWTAPAYNDTSWPSGLGLLAYETCGCLPEVIRTTLSTNNNRTAFYFRTHFNLSGSPAGAALKISTVLDDGAVFYLNGSEIYRQNMLAGPVTFGTLANPGVGDATLTGPFILPGSALVSGDNVLAVEVHQSGTTSSDLVFGMTLETTYDVVARYTPGAANSVRSTRPPFPRLWMNELLATNFFLGTNGITDGAGERDPWVELYNGGTNALSLAGFFLANNYSNLTQWAFPANASIGPKQFLLVWLDGEVGESTPTEFHANFRTTPGAGSVVLSKGATLADVVDHLNYNVPVPGRSYGSFPDGAVSGRRLFSIVTPKTTNDPATPPADVRINEWMADNDFTLVDPADGDYEDWFEIHNPGTNLVDLSGYFLTDTLANTTLYQIPDGTTIPAGGYLLVWADEESGQNDPTRVDLHAELKLNADGEAIWLFAPDGQIVDGVSFGIQTTDISQGRFPDGAASIYSMTNSTPRAPNTLSSANTPPMLSLLIDRTVNEGSTLNFVVAASDADLPAQTLTFSLDPGAPAGAGINSSNGLFAWAPAEVHGPGSYPITIRVTDDGTPNLSATRSFVVTVNEVNNSPTLTPLISRTVAEGDTLTVTNSATDSDTPPQSFTYSLDPGAPAGASINPTNGVFTWTPSEAYGPGNHAIVIRVTDNGDPPMSDTETLTVTVLEVNVAPTLSFATNQSVDAEATLSFTAIAMDSDLPEQLISFSLDPGFPAGAGIDPSSGLFTWTPPTAQIGTHNLTVRATDNGTPPAAGIRPLTVVVQSSLRVRIGLNGGQVTISFSTVNGRHYRVEYKQNLGDAVWTELAQGTGNGSMLSFPDNPGPSLHRFYRVVQTD